MLNVLRATASSAALKNMIMFPERGEGKPRLNILTTLDTHFIKQIKMGFLRASVFGLGQGVRHDKLIVIMFSLKILSRRLPPENGNALQGDDVWLGQSWYNSLIHQFCFLIIVFSPIGCLGAR